jgi:hypothetical protein
MAKVDLRKDLKHLYTASTQKITFVNAPRLHFLMLDGLGNPEAPEFQQAAAALFSVAYALKFMIKQEQGRDYGVMPLEGLWWTNDGSSFSLTEKDRWLWTLMVMQPEFMTPELVDSAKAEVKKKKNLALLEHVKFLPWCEGEAAQILHAGPFADEHATVARLHAFIKDKGYHLCGKHHEIYLSDPRRTQPDRLKTIIRQPVTLEAMQ